MNEAPKVQHVCDGCGETVDAAHVRDRIARLEMATRFRPLRIRTLLLAAAPPPALEDFFYFTQRDPASDRFFRAIVGAAGVDVAGKSTQACLAEFQRHGIYLAHVNECPAGREVSLERLADTLVRRIRFSYKPKSVLLLEHESASLLPFLATDKLPGVRVLKTSIGWVPPGGPADPNAFQRDVADRLQECAR